MAVVEPREYKFKPLPTDEWLYAVIASKPEDAESSFGEGKRIIKVQFRIEQDYDFTYTDETTGAEVSRNIKGDSIPRIFPQNWPNDKTKRLPLLYTFVEAIAPQYAKINQPFDSDVLEGIACFIMIEDQKKVEGGTFQKVTKWKSPKKTSAKAAATPKVAVAATAVTTEEEGTVDY